MLPRFLAPDAAPGRDDVVLDADESHHLTRVLRLGVGADVEVFDGAAGHQFLGRVKAVDRSGVTVALVRALDTAPESGAALVFAQAVLKGDKMDDVVRDATMMGARTIAPLISAHVTVKLQALERGRPAERWRRIALASAKQCRRPILPAIHEPQSFERFLARPEGGVDLEAVRTPHPIFLLVEPSAAPPGTQALRAFGGRSVPSTVTIVAGPEGGWAPQEIEMALGNGATPVTLGPLTLRADAVAVAALAMIRMLWEE